MKIIQLASGDLWAGAEVQLFHLARALSRRNEIELLVILLNEGQLANELRTSGVRVAICDESKLSSLSIFLKLYRLTKIFKPDVIHTHRSKENILGGLISFLAKTKSVRTVHGANEFSNLAFSLKRFFIDKLNWLVGYLIQDRVIAVSNELNSKLQKIYSSKKLITIHNSIDYEFIIEKSKESMDRLPDKKNYNVAFIGRFVPVKRVDMFYQIAKQVIRNDQLENIHFYMIGDGPLWSKTNRDIEDEGMQSRIHLTGFVKNTAPYLRSMDLLLFTSDHEGLPMTLLEAIILNVTVMTRDLATIKHVLCDGECGYVIASDKLDDYSRLIINLRDDQSEAMSKNEKAIQSLKANYTIDMNVERYINTYKSILND